MIFAVINETAPGGESGAANGTAMLVQFFTVVIVVCFAAAYSPEQALKCQPD